MTDQSEHPAAAHTTVSSNPASSSAPLWRGVGWGGVATVAMSIPMMIGMAAGVAPMPEPIPKALVTFVFGTGLPAPLLMALSAGSHLGYGGFFGAVLTRLYPKAGLWKGVGLGILLWLIMEIVVLPLLGWGFFGVAISPKIAVATLVLHLIYGGTLGWGLSR